MHTFPHPPFETAIDLMLASDKVFIAEAEQRARQEALKRMWPMPDVSGSMTQQDLQRSVDRQVGKVFRDANRIMAHAGTTMSNVQRRMEAIQRQTLRSLDRRDGYTLPTTPVEPKPAIVAAASIILLAIAGTILAAVLL